MTESKPWESPAGYPNPLLSLVINPYYPIRQPYTNTTVHVIISNERGGILSHPLHLLGACPRIALEGTLYPVTRGEAWLILLALSSGLSFVTIVVFYKIFMLKVSARVCLTLFV